MPSIDRGAGAPGISTAVERAQSITIWLALRRGSMWAASALPHLCENVPGGGFGARFVLDGKLAHLQFETRIVRPLVEFGLLEKRDLEPRKSYRSEIEICKSSLFDRFLRFDF